MGEKRSWWQKTRKHLNAIGLIAAFVVAVALIFIEVKVYGTGFKGKTLWDWLQLLIIPAVLSVAGYVINLTISSGEQAATQQRTQSEREAAEKRAETEREIALDNQREAAVQRYIDNMSKLLLIYKLSDSKPEDEIRRIGRVRTLTVLPHLDPTRKATVLLFLQESGLIDNDKRIIDLSGANLAGAILDFADLRNADLSEANLCGADLNFAFLSEASLIGTDLSEACLEEANLNKADLTGVSLLERCTEGLSRDTLKT